MAVWRHARPPLLRPVPMRGVRGLLKFEHEIAIVRLDSTQIEDAARLFHDIWHETQARLQDPRIARHRDPAFFRRRIVERAARTLVAMSGGRCVGFACWTDDKLNSLFVDNAFRGKGIGGLLCAEAERQMAGDGRASFRLDCLEGNHAAKRFYEARGWREDALRVLDNETADGVCKVAAWKMVKP